jgi:hypothetical protein
MEALLVSNTKKPSSPIAEYASWAARVKDLLCYLELWPIPPTPVRALGTAVQWPAGVEVPQPRTSPADPWLPTYSAAALDGGTASRAAEVALDAERRRLKTAAVIRAALPDHMFLDYAAKEFDDPMRLWKRLEMEGVLYR